MRRILALDGLHNALFQHITATGQGFKCLLVSIDLLGAQVRCLNAAKLERRTSMVSIISTIRGIAPLPGIGKSSARTSTTLRALRKTFLAMVHGEGPVLAGPAFSDGLLIARGSGLDGFSPLSD